MQTMLSKISKEEKMMIDVARRGQIDRESSDANFCDTDTFLTPWAQEKNNLFQMFGKELILKFPVEFKMTEEEIINYLNSHNNEAPKIGDCLFLRKFYVWLNEYDREHCLNYKVYEPIRGMAYNESLIKKTCTEDIEMPDGKVKITKGTKIIKAFRKLNEVYKFADEEDFEDFRLKHSMLFNQATLKGNYCLSIHPLDFITLSDNESRWTSCMSWKNKGCYRLGTIEMMTSPYVVVGYLEAKEPMEMKMGCGEWGNWNNKKWRTMFFVHEDIITSIKSYPYFSEYLIKFGLDKLTELAEKYWKNVKYEDTYRDSGENCFDKTWTDEETGEVKIRFAEFTCNYMYNDFGTTTHFFKFSNLFNKPENRDRDWNYYDYSGPAVCVCCGRVNNFAQDGGEETETMCCDDCIIIEHCEICGDRIYSNDYTYSCLGHDCICSSCNDDTIHLEYCDEYAYYDDIRTTYLAILNENGEFRGSTLRVKQYEGDDDLGYCLERKTISKPYGNYGNREKFLVFNSFEDLKDNYEELLRWSDSEDLEDVDKDNLEGLREEFFMKI